MAPKKKAAKIVGQGPQEVTGKPSRMPLSKMSFGPDSGWRALIAARLAELRTMCLDGKYGMTVLGAIQLLEKTDIADKNLIDDGLHISTVLYELEVEWQQNKDEDPNGTLWHPSLVDVFENGVPVRFVRYADDSHSVRRLWNVGKHEEDVNNTYTRSSVFMKIEQAADYLAKEGGDTKKAEVGIVAVLGDGKVALDPHLSPHPRPESPAARPAVAG